MRGLQKFFSFAVVVIFCFCLAVLPGCWDGDGSGNANPTTAPISSTLPTVEPGQPTGGFRVYINFNAEIMSRAKVNNNSEYQLMPFLRSRVTLVKFFLWRQEAGEYSQYGEVVLPVINGLCDGEVDGILIGDYSVHIQAEGMFNVHFSSENNLKIEAGKTTDIDVKLELNNTLMVPMKITNPVGNYIENKWYNVNAAKPNGFFSTCSGALYKNGELTFHVWCYRPFDDHLEVTIENEGGSHIYYCLFNILGIIALHEGEFLPLTLDSEAETGSFDPDITFEDEEVFKLSRSSEISDGTPENPTGYAGDPNCLVGSFILQVDNDETVAGRFVCIFMTEIIQQYFKSVGYYINKMGQNDSEIISYQANLDSIKFVYGSASLPMFGEEFEPGFYQLKIRARIKEGVQTPEAFSIGVSCHAQGVDTGIYYSTQRVESQKIFIAPVVVYVPANAKFTGEPGAFNASGGTRITAANFKIIADGEVKDVAIEVPLNGAKVIQSIYLFHGTECLNEFNCSMLGDRTIKQVSLPVTAGEAEILRVEYALREVGGWNVPSGLNLRTTLKSLSLKDSLGYYKVVEANAAGNDIYVYRSYPVVTQIPLSTEEKQIVNGNLQTVYKWEVAAVKNDISIKQMPRLKVSWRDVDDDSELRLSNFRMFRGDMDVTDSVDIFNQDGVSVKSGVTDMDTAIFIYFVNEDVVSGGASEEYRLVAAPENFNTATDDPDMVSLIMMADNAPAGNKRFVFNDNGVWKLAEDAAGMNAGQFNFIWSDRSALPHSDIVGSSSNDWLNGYLIKYLPLNHEILGHTP